MFPAFLKGLLSKLSNHGCPSISHILMDIGEHSFHMFESFERCDSQSTGIFWALGVIKVALFMVLSFKWSVNKHCVAKILLAAWDTLLYENNCNYDSCKFCYKSTFIPFLSFRRNQKT